MNNQQRRGKITNKTLDSQDLQLHVELDGYYGWLVVLASHICMLFVLGVFQAIGPLFIALVISFNETSTRISWILSFLVFLANSLGCISSWIVDKIGYRMTVMVGSILSSIGLFLSAFAPNIEFLYFSTGILVGAGYGIIMPPALGIMFLYIKKRCALANAIAVSGGGVATIIFPPLIQSLIDNYGWRGAFVLFSAINAHMCVSAALFRIPKTFDEVQSTNTSATGSNNNMESEECTCQVKLNDITCQGKLNDIINYKLFVTYPSLLVHTIATFLAFGIGYFGAPAHLAARAETENLGTSQDIVFIISMYGIGGTFGRLVIPLLLSRCGVRSTRAYGLCFVLTGIADLLSVFANTYISYMAFAICFGVLSGTFLSLMSQAIKDIVGSEYFTAGIGLVFAIAGLGGIIGPTCAGHIYDVTKDYNNSFYFYGCFSVIGGIFMLAVEPLTTRRLRKSATYNKKSDEIN
ncbi:monocarboxylate transporter 13-like [Glandiceps talaboti]